MPRLTLPAALRAMILALLCVPLSAFAAIELVDDIGRPVRLARAAQRIVSLAPHVTELLFAAGAGKQVVGVVDYSDFPAEATHLPQVGSYTNVDLEAVAALRPDLIVAWRSGNRPAQVDRLAALGIPVYVTEPRSIDDVAHSVETMGRLAGTSEVADRVATRFRERATALRARHEARPKVRMFYQIWDRPLMTINGEHLISDVIGLCGGENVFERLPQLAATVSIEAVLATNPEAIVASGMGEARPEWLDDWKRWPGLEARRAGNLFFVPPELIQRHTPRILDGAERLCAFLEQARERRSAGAGNH